MADGALGGLRVVELGGEIAAAYATKLLADLGADVLKLEPPGGDPLRAWGPFPAGRVDVAHGGGLFRYLNANKRGRVAELADPSGAGVVLEAAAGADVVVESLGAGELERHGLGAERLAAASPRLSLVRISDFGQDGPRVGMPTSQLVLQALGGWVSTHGVPGTRLVQVGGRIPEYTVGTFAGCAALTAWRAARDGDAAVTVDLSVLECLIGTLPYPMLFKEVLEELGLPAPQARHFPLPGIVRCRDGWVGINALTGQHWVDACAMLGADDWAHRQQELAGGGPELDAFFDFVRPWFDARDAQEIVELSQAFRIPAAPIGDGRMLAEYAQFRERPFFVDEPEDGFPMPGPPYRLSATPARLLSPAPRLDPAPVSDAHAREYLDPGPRERGRDPGDRHLPFAGLRVIDLTTFWAGPYATMYLGAFGADVIKVESIQRPDGFRFSGAFPQMGDDWYERSGVWQSTNLNKRDITLDLTREEGRELLERLCETADVMIENFSARVVEQFGFDYNHVRATKPDIVMVRMPGFGIEGPWRDYVGWAMVIEQATGMAAITGWPDQPLSPGGFIDPVIGLHAAVAIQAALEHRARTGEGQLIEAAQLETGTALTAEQVIDWALNRRTREREANRHRVIAPQGVYPCRDDDWVALSICDDAQWTALAETIGTFDLRALPLSERHARHDELDERIAAWTRDFTPIEIVARLRPHGIPAAPVLTVAGMYDEPQLVVRQYYQPLDNPKTGVQRYPGWPMRFSFGREHHRFGPPTLGAHNDDVLGADLRLDGAELRRLRAEQLIGERMARS